ncbi:MAG: DUF2461 domain-containing protein [Candidatus Nanopelagicales bacterium]
MTESGRFGGFPTAAFDFYDGLGADNSKTYWNAHRQMYDDAVRAPMIALLAELEPEFGAANVFRPYRDARFSKDKRPYKDHQGAFVGAEDAVGWYVQVGAEGLLVAGGWYAPQGSQLSRFRDAVDSAPGTELARVVAALRAARYAVGGDVLKTRPRGIDPEHPRIELLRHRSLTCTRQHGTPAWVSTRTALRRIQQEWRAMSPLVEWLADHVGPAEDGPPPEPR